MFLIHHLRNTVDIYSLSVNSTLGEGVIRKRGVIRERGYSREGGIYLLWKLYDVFNNYFLIVLNVLRCSTSF